MAFRRPVKFIGDVINEFGAVTGFPARYRQLEIGDAISPDTVPVSAGAGNAIEVRDDGLFVPPGSGSGGGSATNLDSLTDVQIANPQTGQAVVFNGTRFVNQAVATNLDGLTDVAVSTPQSGQVIRHNGTQFVNSTVIVGFTTPTVTDLLTLSASPSLAEVHQFLAPLLKKLGATVASAPSTPDGLFTIGGDTYTFGGNTYTF